MNPTMRCVTFLHDVALIVNYNNYNNYNNSNNIKVIIMCTTH